MNDQGPIGAWLEDLTWPEARQRFDNGALLVIPIGAAAKEHGPHLPLNTDYLVARALGERIARALPVVVAPVLAFGYYPAFRHYPGSQHLRAETFMSVLRDLLSGFIDQGVRNIAIVNTGVSTEAPIRMILRELLEETGIRISCADIRALGARTAGIFEQQLGGHGDEHETSLILAIKPEAVRMDRTQCDYGNMLDQPRTVFYQPSIFATDTPDSIDYSPTGARGDPTRATVEKGHAALDDMVDELITGLRRLYPQALDGTAD